MNYIVKTFSELKNHFPVFIERQIKDEVGLYAYLCFRRGGSRFFYVAKNSSLGDTVSIHKEVVEASIKTGFQIVMCLKGKYYKMYGAVIYASKPYENIYHGATMINFTLPGVTAELIPVHGSANSVASMVPRSTEQLKMMFERVS